MEETFLCIGKAMERQDAPDKVTGRAAYAGDIHLPGMLYGAVLRSHLPHARIEHIDVRAALELPGVRAVLTAGDLPKKLVGERVRDMPVLAMDRVRFVGERVAAVAAVDEATARQAAASIRVAYDPLPGVFTTAEALRMGAPLVHEDLGEYANLSEQVQGNVYAYDRIERGSLEEGWAQADHIFEDTFSTQAVHQGYVEQHAVVAAVELDGRATIWTCNKAPFRLRQLLARYLGIQENLLRVVTPAVGGDFGGKGAMMDEPLCYLLSRKTGRPVRMVMSRSEELAAANPRHPSSITVKSGVKRSGELVARQVTVFFDSGAYGGAKPGQIVGGYSRSAGPYRIPHVLIEGYSLYTNNNPSGHCRAPGDPQAVFAVESHTDLVARRLGMDPLDFRLLNVLQEGEETPTGELWREVRGREALEEVARLSDWRGPRPPATGKGLSLAYRKTGAGESSALVMVNADGSVEILSGAVDTGTGNWTVLRQVAAEELGVSPDRIRLVTGDTAAAPFDRGSGGSRGTHVAGLAVQLAARDALGVLRAAAGSLLGCPGDEVSFARGEFRQVSQPERSLTWSEVAAFTCRHGAVMGRASYTGSSKGTVAFTANVAEVAVDGETGRVEVTRLAAVHDIGRTLNPPAAEGQVEGGIVQGMGFALWENLDKQEGKLVHPFLADYHQPTSLDMPQMDVAFIEGAPGPAPYGGKGIGEVSINPVAAAIANAVEDAVGVRMKDLPLLPERLWRALKGA